MAQNGYIKWMSALSFRIILNHENSLESILANATCWNSINQTQIPQFSIFRIDVWFASKFEAWFAVYYAMLVQKDSRLSFRTFEIQTNATQSKINTFLTSEHLNIFVLCRVLCNLPLSSQIMDKINSLFGRSPVHVFGTFSILMDFNVQSIFL